MFQTICCKLEVGGGRPTTEGGHQGMDTMACSHAEICTVHSLQYTKTAHDDDGEQRTHEHL